MNKVSELLGKPIISIFDAKIMGTIGNIYFDKKLSKGVFLALFDDETSDADEKFVELNKVVCIDSDAAVIKDSGYVTYGWNTRLGASNPINKPAYSQDGKLLGIVRDIILDGVNVVSFIVDTNEISVATLLAHSDNALVFNDSGKPIKPPPRKKIPKEKAPQRIELHYPKQAESTNKKQSEPIKKPKKGQERDKEEAIEMETLVEVKQAATVKEAGVQAAIQQDERPQEIESFEVVQQAQESQENEANPQSYEKTEASETPQSEDDFPANYTATIEDSKPSEQQNSNVIISENVEKTESAAQKAEPQNVQKTETSAQYQKQEFAAQSMQKAEIGVPHRIPKSSTNVSRMPMGSSELDNKFDFLIGKLLEKSIYDDNGAILIRANTLITAEVIALCKTHSRLVQLALHSFSPSK